MIGQSLGTNILSQQIFSSQLVGLYVGSGAHSKWKRFSNLFLPLLPTDMPPSPVPTQGGSWSYKDMWTVSSSVLPCVYTSLSVSQGYQVSLRLPHLPNLLHSWLAHQGPYRVCSLRLLELLAVPIHLSLWLSLLRNTLGVEFSKYCSQSSSFPPTVKLMDTHYSDTKFSSISLIGAYWFVLSVWSVSRALKCLILKQLSSFRVSLCGQLRSTGLFALLFVSPQNTASQALPRL